MTSTLEEITFVSGLSEFRGGLSGFNYCVATNRPIYISHIKTFQAKRYHANGLIRQQDNKNEPNSRIFSFIFIDSKHLLMLQAMEFSCHLCMWSGTGVWINAKVFTLHLNIVADCLHLIVLRSRSQQSNYSLVIFVSEYVLCYWLSFMHL